MISTKKLVVALEFLVMALSVASPCSSSSIFRKETAFTQEKREELEVLSSIYGEEFSLEDESPPTFSVAIRLNNDKEASLMVTFETEYPKKAPPIFQLSIPWIRGQKKMAIYAELEELYLEHMGESIVYLWVEKLRELLDKEESSEPEKNKDVPEKRCSSGDLSQDVDTSLSDLTLDKESSNESVEVDHKTPTNKYQSSSEKKVVIVTGEPFTDRKSTFQAHVAIIDDQAQVRMVLNELYVNKKIKSATHNMYAYRIMKKGTNSSFIQDCDDDGETHAGSRLLHLLQILDCRNVIVVVTRWFGGIQLHADRFKHINNVARLLLEQQGLIHADKGSRK